jgi:hypothetical protein
VLRIFAWAIGILSLTSLLVVSSRYTGLSQVGPDTQALRASEGMHAATEKPIGAPASGVALSLSASSNVFHIGQPMLVTEEMRNVTAGPVDLVLGNGGHVFWLKVLDSSGNFVPRLAQSGGGATREFTIQPGQAFFVHNDINAENVMTTPGSYYVKALTEAVWEPGSWQHGDPVGSLRRVQLTSNTVTIQVVP